MLRNGTTNPWKLHDQKALDFIRLCACFKDSKIYRMKK